MRNPRTLLESSGNKPQRNGGISNTLTTQSSTTTPLSARSNTGDDIDIQILQQKKQQAEIKRCVSYLYYSLQQLLGVVYSLLLFSLRAHNSRLLIKQIKKLYILTEMETRPTFLSYVCNAKKIKELFYPT